MNFDSYYTNLLEQLECDHGLEDWSGLLQAQSIGIEGIVSNLMDTLIPYGFDDGSASKEFLVYFDASFGCRFYSIHQ